METGRVRDALLEEADLVEWGEKIDKSIPASLITSLVQRLRVSRDANRTGVLVVKKNLVVGPLSPAVLSK
ncbi:hypothetical protein Pmani_027913 [Petrolisthes manimaculis]|uniref:Uncharacterized protein n=1 Tax=Petrolisthes manimaculis TaxID=1843537 RepID=A0AAE1TW80_9EUCA|nr:hypothetical protein Pmani_027913 [Petrolisthes manimaculis]